MLTALAAAAVLGQGSGDVFAAPRGVLMREAAPDLNIFYAVDRPRSHVNVLGDIGAKGRASACEPAFFVALAQLAEAARDAGGNGIVNLRSPSAPDGSAPTYVCTRLSSDRAEVSLAASAARLNGSDAPYVAPTRPRARLPATAAARDSSATCPADWRKHTGHALGASPVLSRAAIRPARAQSSGCAPDF